MPTIRKEAAYALISSVIYAAGQWLLVTILIKSGGVTEAGFYALGMAIITPVLTLANLNLRAAQVMDSEARWTFGQYCAVRIATSAAGFVICAMIGWVALGGGWERQTAFWSLALYRFFEALSDIVQGHFQRSGQYRLIATAYLIKCIVGLAGFFLAFRLTGHQWLGFLVLAVISQVVFWVYEIPNLRRYANIELVWSDNLWRLVKETAPLGFAMVISAFQLNIPRYLLERYSGTRELGVFAALSYLVVLANLVGSAAGNALAPAMGRLWDQSNRKQFRTQLWRILGLDVGLGAIAVSIAIGLGAPLLRFFYNNEVAEYARLLPWFGVVATVSCFDAHFGMAITAMKKNKTIFMVHIIRLFAVTPFIWWLIKNRNLDGCIFAVGLCYLFSTGYLAIVFLREMREQNGKPIMCAA